MDSVNGYAPVLVEGATKDAIYGLRPSVRDDIAQPTGNPHATRTDPDFMTAIFRDQWTIDGDQIVPEGYSHDKGKSNAQTSYGHSILGDTYFDTETFWKAHGECKPPEDVSSSLLAPSPVESNL